MTVKIFQHQIKALIEITTFKNYATSILMLCETMKSNHIFYFLWAI